MADEINEQDVADILSQTEVEKLLSQVNEEENTVKVHSSERVSERKDIDRIQPFDFRHPSYLSSSELRRLRLRHEEFIRTLTARLSLYLRLEIGIQMAKLETTSFEKWTEGLTNPTHLTVIKADPFKGAGILEIHPRLGLTIVDRLLGGPAHSVDAEREFTEIEMALLDQAVNTILEEYCAHWSDLYEIRHTILGHESNGRFIQSCTPETIILILAIEFRIGDCLEQMQLAFPCSTLEPLIRKLSEVSAAEQRHTDKRKKAAEWDPRFDSVKIPVKGIWNDLTLSAREIADLQVGDVLQLRPSQSGEVVVQLGDIPKFLGRLGSAGEKRALELASVIKGD